MEAVGLTASVITLVGVIKTIHKIISSVEEAPKNIQHLSTTLPKLSSQLQQLHAFQDDLCLASDLPQLISQCRKHVEALEEKVGKLLPIKSGKKHRLWNNVKASIQDSDIDRASTLLQSDVTNLSLQLDIIK